MKTVRNRFHGIAQNPRIPMGRAYYYIKDEMNGDSVFYAQFWDTEITDAVWRELLKEALK